MALPNPLQREWQALKRNLTWDVQMFFKVRVVAYTSRWHTALLGVVAQAVRVARGVALWGARGSAGGSAWAAK